MSWNSAAEFFAMGGDGVYVWGAYVAAALAAGGECGLLLRRWRRAVRHAVQTHRARGDA